MYLTGFGQPFVFVLCHAVARHWQVQPYVRTRLSGFNKNGLKNGMCTSTWNLKRGYKKISNQK